MADSKIHGFRYDINALRAIAVIGVLLFHYEVPGFVGGFTGVDVFFVISGYLMSKIIFTAIDRGDFSVLDFYSKRLKRILPALLFLIAILTFAGFFFFFPDDYRLNAKNSAASILFISNITYWQSAGYFAAASATNILLHTWSLSVEWQFYMIYPVVLLLVSRYLKNKNRLLVVFSIITLLIFVGSIYYNRLDKDASFFLLPSRCWEMMVGGIALLGEGFVKRIKYKWILAIIGYFIIFACLFMINSDRAWPGKFTMIPVFGTFMVLIVGCNDFKVLKLSIVQLLGKISYSLYLWHWPVYVIALYMGIQLNGVSITAMTLISCVLAYLSFRFIESVKFSNKVILVAMGILAISTYILSVTHANKIVFNPRALELANYDKTHRDEKVKQFNKGTCFMSGGNAGIKDYDKTSCLAIKPGKNVLLIGDSHAAHLSSALKKGLANININLLQATSSGCMPIVKKGGKDRCREIIDYIYDDFIKHHADEIDGVIISANWVAITNEKQLEEYLNATIDYLKEYNVKVVLMGQNETYNISYPVIKAKEVQYGMALSDRYLVKDAYQINDFLKRAFKSNYIEIINVKTFPKLSDNGDPYMGDKNHYTEYGASIAVQRILSNPVFVQFLK